MSAILKSVVGAGVSAAVTSPKKADAALTKVAQQFEAVFVRQMMSTMRQAKLADEVFGSSATDSFQEMADARTADSLASLGQFGIASLIERQFQGRGSIK